MKVREIIQESSTDLIARFWAEGDLSIDAMLNPEANEIINNNKSYYKKYFKEYEEHGITPVFTNIDNNSNHQKEKWDNHPGPDDSQSAGFRGKQHALARAGIPHESSQTYDSTYVPNQERLDNI